MTENEEKGDNLSKGKKKKEKSKKNSIEFFKSNEEIREKKKLIVIFFLLSLIIISLIIIFFIFDFFLKIEMECVFFSSEGKAKLLNHPNENFTIFINNDKFNGIDYDNNSIKGDFNVKMELSDDVLDLTDMFKNTDIKKIKIVAKKISKLKGLKDAFSNCKYLEEVHIEGFDTLDLTSISHLFYNSQNLKKFNFVNLNGTNVTNMDKAFAYTNLSEIDLTSFKIDAILNSSGIFEECNAKVLIKKEGKEEEIKKQLKETYPNIEIVMK
jgi:hypothetical protein